MTVGAVQKAIEEYKKQAQKEGKEVTKEEIEQVAEAALLDSQWEKMMNSIHSQ